MIVGIGVDLVSIDRLRRSLARFGDRFAERVLSESEMQRFAATSEAHRASWLAKRFAAKEAVAKALGTGMRAGVHFAQITVARQSSGAPRIELAGAALARWNKLGAAATHVSISDEADYAAAFVVIESSGD